MTHCSLGTDKDMETQENETNQDTTPPTNGTPIQLLFFLLLFLFYSSFLSCRDPHQQQKNKYTFTAGLRTISLTRSTDAKQDTETPPSHPPKQATYNFLFVFRFFFASNSASRTKKTSTPSLQAAHDFTRRDPLMQVRAQSQ